MTRDELKELACLKFAAPFVLQSFCHTAAYPKPSDINMHRTLPAFFQERGGVALRPGDGIIHTWLNRTVLPDTVGTGGDSHTRFPIGISFAAGSGLVAFAAALGSMPVDMPESVLVRFKGDLHPGITLRDAVNAIAYFAIQQGKVTTGSEGKKNVFNGRIIEIEGLNDLTVDQAYELSNSSAERSAAAATIELSEKAVAKFVEGSAALLESLVRDGYESKEALERRAAEMRAWLAKPSLLRRDPDAEFADTLEIDLDEITEPILACPNDPDKVELLSQHAGRPIDEVFIGSCMTNVAHFRAVAEIPKGKGQAPVRLWLCPPTRMDAQVLRDEGLYAIFGGAGARIEIPGCSLCMGNQARVGDNTTVFSTSTRNFNDRIGKGAQVYLGSAELGAVVAALGKIPTPEQYFEIIQKTIEPNREKIYRYLDLTKVVGSGQ
jgi:aconitate hydratase 2/2-methylisocitrate dehydratase